MSVAHQGYLIAHGYLAPRHNAHGWNRQVANQLDHKTVAVVFSYHEPAILITRVNRSHVLHDISDFHSPDRVYWRDYLQDLAELVALNVLDAQALARINWPRIGAAVRPRNPVRRTVGQFDGWLQKSGASEWLANDCSDRFLHDAFSCRIPPRTPVRKWPPLSRRALDATFPAVAAARLFPRTYYCHNMSSSQGPLTKKLLILP
jgi:hypothetical protein